MMNRMISGTCFIRYYNTSRPSLQLVPDQPLCLPSRPLLYKAGMGQGYLELPQGNFVTVI